MTKRALALLALLLTVGAGSASASTPHEAFTRHRYIARDAKFSRDYWLFHPTRLRRPATLVVFLHGCVSTDPARDAAVATGWNRLADQRGFMVVYPEQRIDQSADGNAASRGNGTGCWNWFQTQNQQRGSGEAATIAGITRRVASKFRIDGHRVYLMGASAGADMTVNLAASYPDLYAAVSVFSACAYRTCTDGDGSAAFAAMGPRARVVPVLYAQGSADNLNPLPLGTSFVQQWLGTDDLADDGQINASIARAPASIDHHGLDGSLIQGVGTVGDICVRPNHWGCPGGLLGFRNSYPYSVAHFVDAKGSSILDAWTIHGLMHAYPNGEPGAQYTDPLGPDITKASYRFFMAHPMEVG